MPSMGGLRWSADPPGQGLYLLVDDVDGFYRQAVAAGGTGVIEPENTEWGARRARVLDPQGYEWSAGTYEPGVGRYQGSPRQWAR